MSYVVGCRHGSDLALLWLWHRPVATALTRLLALEPPYAAGVTLKRQKKKKLGTYRLYRDTPTKEHHFKLTIGKLHLLS